jgi:hypothetical protein
MRSSPGIFTSGPFGGRRSTDLQLAWADAADDAREAYFAWRETDRVAQSQAFLVYAAALDREEAAARALQLQASAPADRLRSS